VCEVRDEIRGRIETLITSLGIDLTDRAADQQD